VLPNPLPAVLQILCPHAQKIDDSYFRNEQVHQFSRALILEALQAAGCGLLADPVVPLRTWDLTNYFSR